MKHRLQTFLKHNLQWLVLLTALLSVSQGVWGQDKIGIYNRNGSGKWEEFNFSNKKVTVEFSSVSTVYVHVIQGSETYALSNNTMSRTSHTGWWLYLNNNDCGVTIDVPGNYTFERSDVTTVDNTKHVALTVSYPWVIRGNFSGSWKSYNISSGTTATITDAVANSSREFKVFTDNVYSCQTSGCGTITRDNCSNWILYNNNSGNTSINMDVSGTYIFTWSNDNNHKLSVTYPTYKLRGSWDNWSDATDFTYVSSTSWTCTKSFSVTGVYNFNIRPASGSDYKGNGKYITRAHTSETLVPTSGDGNDVSITIDHTGSYTFNFNPSTGGLTVTYPTPSAPSGLYIKGPLVNNGAWTDNYRQNWSSMTYNKTNNVYTFSFNASNACNDNCSNQSLHFCVSTGTDDKGKIHWAMNSTRTNWAFAGNTDGNNFVASSTLVNGTSVPVVLTITYNTSTYKYDMALTAACTAPTVTTVNGASNVTSSAARLTGNISSIGDCGSPVVGIAYGTNSSPTTLAPYSGSLSTGDFTVDISGLTAGTRYYYRAYSKSRSSDDPVYDENVYSFYTNPSELYIKGPLVYDSKWDPYTQDNVGYSHTAGTNTFVFSFNARTGDGGTSDSREYCVSTTNGEGGKIQSSMDGTTSGWSFENGRGTNFVASSTIVSTDNTAIDITITYNNSTGQYHMVLAAACSGAPTINNGDIASKNWTKCGNENGRELSITASGGSGTLTYQWFRNSLASETGATAVTDMVEGGNTYSPSSTDYGTYYYYCVVRSGGACSSNKATSSFTGAITIKQTPTVTPAAVTVKQYEPVTLTATNSSVNWSITAHPDGATADEYYLYDETKSTTMFKGKTGTGSYTITATSTGDGSCTATSSITVEEDDNEGC